MIGKISPALGSKPAGLLCYLFGPGRHNEHTDPRLVASAATLDTPAGWRPATHDELLALARDLDRPHLWHRADHPGGYVWHCSLSLPTDDGVLSDETWGRIARAVMDRMGFGVGDRRAPCRWVAVRHGLSTGGNDHIHLVVNLVRENGRRASNWRDRVRLSAILAQVEKDFGLTVVGGRARGGLPGITRAETEIARRCGAPEPARVALARIVRAAATASADEAEFVRRLRATRAIRLRPRYAPGGTREVVGYAVALAPPAGRATAWFGGGRLAADLALPRLRARWPRDEVARAAAVHAWLHGGHGGRESRQLREQAWDRAADQVAAMARRLAAVPVEDTVSWSEAAREAAGLYAALSLRLEGGRPGALARAAAALAYSAQSRPARSTPRSSSPAVREFAGAAMTALQAGPVGRSSVGQLLLQQMMLRMIRVVHDAHAARGDAIEAARLARTERAALERLHTDRAEYRAVPRSTPSTGPSHTPHPPPARRDPSRGTPSR